MKIPTPKGYNDHDYQKLVTFLNQTDDEGVPNGKKLSEEYDPTNPTTWGTYWNGQRFKWVESNGELMIQKIYIECRGLCGTLDLSECTALIWLCCDFNKLTKLDVNGCTALEDLYCYANNLTKLNVSGCAALEELYCHNNKLTKLNVSGCAALWRLWCGFNKLTKLNVSGCISLKYLSCYSNKLGRLNLNSCPQADCFCDDKVKIKIRR